MFGDSTLTLSRNGRERAREHDNRSKVGEPAPIQEIHLYVRTSS